MKTSSLGYFENQMTLRLVFCLFSLCTVAVLVAVAVCHLARRQIVAGLMLFGLALASHATTYSLPAAIGSGPFSACSFQSGTTYQCSGSIDFGNDNSVILNITSNMTLSLGGSFTAKNNVDTNCSPGKLSIIVGGSVDFGTNLSACVNITAGGSVTIKNNGSVAGDITAGGTINLSNGTTVSGNCNPAPTGSGSCTTTGPVRTLSIANASKTEGDVGTTALNFTVTLSASTTIAITVNYATSNGTATVANTDYVATSGTLTFNAGETSKTVSVTINGDTVVEPDETFTVTLSSPTNATIATGSATGTILNDDVGCGQPSNTPVGMTLTCQCDSFGRAALNPSPIFTNGNWITSISGNDSTGIVPYINATTGFLRLTENTGNNSKAVTAPGFFPAAGNYISVEFKHYAYNGSGADGIAVVLSDYSVPPVPGASGGSLGYAQKTGIPGFAGGWIGVAVDEYGNFLQNGEGRVGGYGSRITDTVSVRGSGSGTTGYPFLAPTGAASLSPGVDNAGSASPAYGHYYQIIVDARNSGAGQTSVAVNRDTTGTGTSYPASGPIPSFEIFSTSTAAGYTQAAVPANFQLSFTGSTGGSTNIHELDAVRICAQYYVPPDGGTAGGFSAIDDAYTSTIQNFLAGHIYTKLAGTAFKLKVAAISNSQIQTTYAASGTKNVAVKLVDNSDGLCGTDLTRVTECAKAACNGKSAVAGGSQTLAFTSVNKGIKTSADFTLPSAHANLVAVMTEGSVTACSLDSFSVRPTKITSVTSTNATNTGLTGTPKFKAGTDSFALAATANAVGYTGTPKINTAAMSTNPASGTVGAFTPTLFPAAVSGASTSVATGSFTYAEVGNFRFAGFDPATDTSSARGIYDDSWVTIDSVSTKNDCVAGSYANTKDANGKYGCLFGLQDGSASAPNSVLFGRFVPDHFAYLGGGVSQFCTVSTAFTYMGQAKLGVAYRLQALNGGGGVTTNYSQALGYPVVNPALVAEDQATGNQGCDLGSRVGSLATAQWTAGVYNFNDANADNVPETATAVFSRPTVPGPLSLATCAANKANAGGPFSLLDIGVSMSDSDASAVMSALDMDAGSTGVCSGVACTARKIGSVNMLFGRLWLGNAYGSDQLDLALPFELKYWNGSAFVKNTADNSASCTAFGVANVALGNKQGGLSSYTGPVSVGALVSGAGKITLPKPGSAAAGSVDLVVTLGSGGTPANCPNMTGATSASLAHLSGKWCGTANDRDPIAKATFGIFGSSEKKGPIYIRESY